MHQRFAEIMMSFPMFEGYTVHGTHELIDRGRLRELDEGDVLFREGDPSTTAVLVLSGRIELFLERHGRRLALTDAAPSRMFGELALLSGTPRTCSARASTPSAVLEWEADPFRRLMVTDVVLSERIFRAVMTTLVEEEQALLNALAVLKEESEPAMN
jgi:CRP-like cAMP-binding protein